MGHQLPKGASCCVALQGVLLWVWGLIVVWYCLFFWHQDPKNKNSHVEKTRTHSSLSFLFVLFWTADSVRCGSERRGRGRDGGDG